LIFSPKPVESLRQVTLGQHEAPSSAGVILSRERREYGKRRALWKYEEQKRLKRLHQKRCNVLPLEMRKKFPEGRQKAKENG